MTNGDIVYSCGDKERGVVVTMPKAATPINSPTETPVDFPTEPTTDTDPPTDAFPTEETEVFITEEPEVFITEEPEPSAIDPVPVDESGESEVTDTFDIGYGD